LTVFREKNENLEQQCLEVEKMIEKLENDKVAQEQAL
jgi:hypothetical protein